MEDPETPNNRISQALIELWQPNSQTRNMEATDEQSTTNEIQATPGLFDETALIHVLVNKEGEPADIPLSTNLGLN